eukprot:GHVN01089714.1.p1 GENE.GHVN01089714.1~~GHVN01089714.1.p1  ORF type:complete len:2181 (+),score=425.58 GHVN01089714.1:632-6544(+)
MPEDGTVTKISDFVFSPSPMFFLTELGFPHCLIFPACGCYVLIIFLAGFLSASTSRYVAALRCRLEVIGSVLLTLSVFTLIVGLVMFTLWFLLGALINSTAFLPYAVMLGSTGFVVYAIWTSFTSAREVVLKYIDENIHFMFSVTLDHWLQASNSTFTGKEQLEEDEKIINMRDKVREELKEGRLRLRRAYQMGKDEGDERSELFTERGKREYHSLSEKKALRKIRLQKIVVYVYEKLSADRNGKRFIVDADGGVQNLEQRMPMGARLASCMDVERNRRVEDFLFRNERALLHDGVICGPQKGYRIERSRRPFEEFTCAIIAVPQYPHPDELTRESKAAMLFDVFDRDEDDVLNFQEAHSWATTLGKKRLLKNSESFCDFVMAFNKTVERDASADGILLSDLDAYYSNEDELDIDYEATFPIQQAEEGSDDMHAEMLEMESSGIEDSDGETSDVDDDDEGLSESDEDSDLDDDVAAIGSKVEDGDAAELEGAVEDARVEKELRSNLNARKLQFIYNNVTVGNRQKTMDELISSVPYLASRILDTHHRLLEPIFGREAVLGLHGPGNTGMLLHQSTSAWDRDRGGSLVSRDSNKWGRRASRAEVGGGSQHHLADMGHLQSVAHVQSNNIASLGVAHNGSSNRLTHLLKLIHLESEQDLIRMFRLSHLQVFEGYSVRMAVAAFYDDVLPRLIHMKACRLVNDRLELTAECVDEVNLPFVFDEGQTSKSASQVIKSVQEYRIREDADIKALLKLLPYAGPLQMPLQVTIVVAMLLEVGVLAPFEVTLERVVTPGPFGDREVEIAYPKHKQCYQFIASTIEEHLGSRTTLIGADQLPYIVKRMVTKNLWFEAFKMLVLFLGFDLESDVLPCTLLETTQPENGAHQGHRMFKNQHRGFDNNASDSSDDDNGVHKRQRNRHQTWGTQTRRSIKTSEHSTIGPLPPGRFKIGADRVGGLEDVSTDTVGFTQNANTDRGPILLALRSARRSGSLNITSRSASKKFRQKTKFLPLDFGSQDSGWSGTARDIEEQNLEKMRKVFQKLSGYTGFLPTDLSDEAIMVLTDNRLNASCVVRCLEHLKIVSRSVASVDSKSTADGLRQMGVIPESPVTDVWASADQQVDVMDWTSWGEVFALGEGRFTKELVEIAQRLTAASPGFMGKSQMIEFVREIQKLFQATAEPSALNLPALSALPPVLSPDVSLARSTLTAVGQGARGTIGGGGVEGGRGVEPNQLTHLQSSWSMIDNKRDPHAYDDQLPDRVSDSRLVSLEIFHRLAVKMGFSCGRRHSRILWLLVSNEVCEEARQFLPASAVARCLLRIYLQPFNEKGELCEADVPVRDVVGYRGYLTYPIFRRLVKKMGVNVADKGLRMMWEDHTKDALDITPFLPRSLTEAAESTSSYLRLEMDRTGMDPTRGRVVTIDAVKRQMPKMLMSGLWPESLRVLLRLSLEIETSESHLESVLHLLERRTNRYDLIKPEDVGPIMSNLSVQGMSFAMLRETIERMKLRLPEQDIKRMFDLMDLNHDKSLSLSELLGGFEVLFRRFTPQIVLNGVGLSYEWQCVVVLGAVVGLLFFFAFIALAFSSFTGLQSSMSTAMQSLLAAAGAVGLQTSASQDIHKVEEAMKKKIDAILDGQLSQKAEEVKEAEAALVATQGGGEKKTHGKPMQLRYSVPKKFRPEASEPRPCVTFTPGSLVRLEPTIRGNVNHDALKWAIFPRLPVKTGLVFDYKTGIIAGKIPLLEDDAFKLPTVFPFVTPYNDRATLTAAYAAHGQGSQLFRQGDVFSQEQLLPIPLEFAPRGVYGSGLVLEESHNDVNLQGKPPVVPISPAIRPTTSGQDGSSRPERIEALKGIRRRRSIGSQSGDKKDGGDVGSVLGSMKTGPITPIFYPPNETRLRPLRMQRKTFMVVCRNEAGSSKTRVTFQIQAKDFLLRTSSFRNMGGAGSALGFNGRHNTTTGIQWDMGRRSPPKPSHSTGTVSSD